MKILIPMAGHSRRFRENGHKGHKAFLQVGNSKMINHVVDMFSEEDEFFFILNEKYVSEEKKLYDYLKKIVPKSKVEVIKSHEKGPVYSLLELKNLNDEDEIIITYCDFTVEWNYTQFKRNLIGIDGAIVTFRGFHPASYGNTYYAYIRTKKEIFLELREKRSFTNDRINEHASAGIYYFRTWETYKTYAKKTLEFKDSKLKESYVSLLYNHMQKDNLKTIIFPCEKFICLGTPEDYNEYQFWYNAFVKSKKNEKKINKRKNSIILIPLAGNGTRFKNEGYRTPKPLIKVSGKPMVQKSHSSLPPSEQTIFVHKKISFDKHNLSTKFDFLFPNCKNILANNNTSGQASTCLLSKDFLPQKELFIASCDYEHSYNKSKWDKILKNNSIDGAIWTFRMKSNKMKNPNAFAYCLTEDDGIQVKKIIEKETISDTPEYDPLVTGTFWYRNGADMILGAEKMIEKEITVNNEYYVGTSINQLIAMGKKFIIFDVDTWLSFGDPFELDIYDYWMDYFEKKY